MEKIKLLWDFRGPNSEKTALHHVQHLKEFSETERLKDISFGTTEVSPMMHSAYMVVQKEHMQWLRDRLKPHRGQVYEEG